MPFTEVNWEQIHKETFFTSDKCWTKCNGGYCCSNNHPDFVVLRFIPMHGTTLLYMEDEYNYLLKKAKVPSDQPRSLSLDFGAEKPLRVIYTPCHHKGECKDIIEPPLLCKLYPIIPVISIDGHMEELYPASIFDLTFKSRNEQIPCAIKNECADFFNSEPHLLQLLKHPYIILYSRAAKAFADVYMRRLKDDKNLMTLSKKDFWQMWENKYLSRQIMDKNAMDDLKQNVAETYENLKKQYKGFSL